MPFMMAEATVNLLAAATFFVGIHFVIAGSRLRDTIVRAIGERAYSGLFSLASVIGLVWLAMAYNRASVETFTLLWIPAPWWQHVAMTVILIAAVLVVLGLTTKSPTSVGQEELVDAPHVVEGIQRVTRHPFLWGVLLWALAHIALNGDVSSLIFFGSFALLGIFGPPSIDAKRARKLGARWQGYAQQTSNVPFAAILAGRNTLKLSEIGFVRPAAGVAVYFALLYAHQWLFGVSALPGG